MIRRFENGDIVTSGRQFAVEGDAVARNVRHRLRLFLGEYYLDISDGTPWFQAILGKTPQDVAELNLKNRILTTPGVATIQRFAFRTDRNERRITVTATVRTADGYDVDTTLDEALT